MRYNNNQFNLRFGNDYNEYDPTRLKAGVFFAGGGGISQGLKPIKEIDLRWILNHDKTAIRTSAFHNKGVQVFWSDVYMQDEKEMEPVDIVQASLECDEHTDANTNEIKDEASYTMGWELNRYLPHLNPKVIFIENVPAFKKWAPLDEYQKPIKSRAGEEFNRWKNAIMDMGYEYKESIRNAADDGLPTRRVRFFCFFFRPGISIEFPETTHNAKGTNGKKKWKSCGQYLDLDNHGTSIFGREFNTSLPKHLRRKLVPNSERRIAGGIKKQYPEFYQFLCKYHAGINPERSYGLDEPLRTVDTGNRFQLLTVEGAQFIADHCQTDHFQSSDLPIKTQLGWQTKQLITLEKIDFLKRYFNEINESDVSEFDFSDADESFLVQYYGGSIQSNALTDPINTIPCRDVHQLLRLEKLQFIAKYFNSSGSPESNTESLDNPLSPVLGINKHQLITILDDFDIKARFLNAEELAECSTFPRDYFSHPELKLSQKSAIQLIGNAVPPDWITVLMRPNVKSLVDYKRTRISA